MTDLRSDQPGDFALSFRFIHASDLHLGKRFGRFPEETRAVLQQARQGLLKRLAETALAHGAGHVLLAGDTFDTETPSAWVQRQALNQMGQEKAVQWWIIPGNHDSAAAESLWGGILAQAPENVHILLSPEVREIADGVNLLPAPCRHRYSGHDLTAWMDGCETRKGELRIGLAHGGVLDFGDGEGGQATIALDRVQKAHLSYLALGDWHGHLSINTRCHYSGTAEADRFKHDGRGKCLLVDLSGPEDTPLVTPVEIGQLSWHAPDLRLTPEADVTAGLMACLPAEKEQWSSTLMRVQVSGWATAPQLQELAEEAVRIGPEFCHFELETTGVHTEFRTDDLDMIASSGALRTAAETLREAALDPAVTQTERAVAEAALNRLFAYAHTIDAREGAQ